MIWPFRKLSRPEPPAPAVTDAEAIVRRARRLRFRVRPLAITALAGAYVGARPGSGLIFSELKPYEPGDDVRHLDWNVTARQDRPYVRRFEQERLLTLWLIVDVSASMRFGLPGATKADRAIQAAALLAAAAIQGGDRVGLMLISDRIEAELPPGAGPRHLSGLLRLLVATPTVSRRTDLTRALLHLRPGRRRGLVVLLSDFLDLGPTRPWREAARRHELMALRVVDPREEELPASGLLALREAESGMRQLIDSGSQSVRAAYAKAARERRAAFLSWCSMVGVAAHDLSTDLDPISPLSRIFRSRSRRGRIVQRT
jgi:uncharacterized protein (DUF58 family)